MINERKIFLCRKIISHEFEVVQESDDGSLYFGNGEILTKEGIKSYKPFDYIMTGIDGEKWPVYQEEFNDLYEIKDGKAIPKNNRLAVKLSLSEIVPENQKFELEIFDEKFECSNEDYLVRGGNNNFWTIEKDIFTRTYEVLREATEKEAVEFIKEFMDGFLNKNPENI